ncbi:Lipid A export ATP-binding/permease protein MsbA [Termitomyces sp. J132]|nr:Lipid A export ATP-binding/permease protein MsbA [Termitomyces sp. J132]
MNEGLDHSITTQQVGIWQFSTIKQHQFDPLRRWNEIVSGLQLFRRLATEISTISPTMLILFAMSKLWEGVESAILMHLSSSLLQIVEAGIRDGKANTFSILVAIVSRLSCAAFVAVLDCWTSHYNPAFKTRVVQYYEMYLMKDPKTEVHISSHDAWDAFETIISFFGEILTFLSQLTLIVHASRFSGGSVFALFCVARPLLKLLFAEDVWSKMWVVNLKHKDYERMGALSDLTTDIYRQDFITGNLKDHILNEYEKSKNKLGDTCTDEYWIQLQRRSSVYLEILYAIAGDLPMVYCAANVIINPSKLSIASIAVLQQSSSMLRCTDGMAFELKDVIFDYPGSKNKSPALKNVSLHIKPGQLVVIVGANGSGKSSLIKLLTRLYDPSFGTLFIDGTPAHEYRPTDVRRTMASFTQDHNLFPLSLYENIAFGDVARSTDTAAVLAAVEQGGATELIAKFVDGLDTILNSQNRTHVINIPDDQDHPLQKYMKTLSKKTDVSGGEKQRLVAARTFMHLNSGRVNFVAVDEPSSALDPEAEFQMFNRLIANRPGKTMVFVTHRFGHLTKHADLILCMKDGAVAESGSHGELMKLDGEYAKLYQIQANAFSNSTQTVSSGANVD